MHVIGRHYDNQVVGKVSVSIARATHWLRKVSPASVYIWKLLKYDIRAMNYLCQPVHPIIP